MACSDTQVAKVSQPPVVSIETPVDGSILDEGVPIPMRGHVVDEAYENELTALAAVWTVDGGRVCAEAVVDAGGTSTCDHTFEPGTATIGFTVTDPDGLSDAASSNVTIQEVNYPTISLEAPYNAQLVNLGDVVTFTARVGDVEDRPDQMTMSWSSDLDGEFSTQGASSDGEASFAFDGLSVGTHALTVTVTDTDGHASVDRATLYVNGVPEAPTVAIEPDPATSAGAIVATIVSDAVDPNNDPVTYRYEWYQNGVLTADVANTILPPNLVEGHTWEVRVYPTDGYGEGDFGSATAVIGNGAPSATSVTISPTTAYTNDTLTAVVSGWYDADGDVETYLYAWSVNGTTIAGAEDATLAGTFFVRGDSVTVTATPWDGTDAGLPVTSGARVIQNSVPTAPTVAISPTRPEDDDALVCRVTGASTDADGDAVAYAYSWTKDGAATAYTTDTVDAGATGNNETWACTVVPSDGTDVGPSGTSSVVVDDYTAPDAPVLSGVDPYRNEDSVTIVGTGEAYATITLYIVSSSSSTTQTTTASSGGTFSFALTGLTRGVSYTYYATATDADGNVSANSNTIGTEACDPVDDYEDATGYGDTCPDPVIDWSVLPDDGLTTLTLAGNILEAGDDDWFLVQTDDDAQSGYNNYRFHVELVDGAGDYTFVVYEGGCTTTYLECDSGSSSDPEGSGYTEFERYAQDQGDGGHGVPSDTRACASGSASYNVCDDLSNDYYIHVVRTSSYSCANYEIEVTNGVW